MHASIGDTLLLVIPFIAILIMGFFRLDQVLFAPSSKPKQKAPRPRFANFEQDGEVLADPDGNLTRRKPSKQEAAQSNTQQRTA